MPLLDHFHPPLSTDRHWESFLAGWSGSIADALNARLPERYFAEQQVHVGSRFEVDVTAFEHAAATRPLATVPVLFPDSIEVLVYSTDAGPTLVAAVELVSPGNKDRAEARQAFVAKCATYLRTGVGVMVVDVVTNRHANLHNDLMAFLGHPGVAPLPDPELFATAYRPSRNPPGTQDPTDRVEVWAGGVAVGGPLPRLFLPLDRQQFVPVDLEATYTEARQRSRLG